MKLLSAVLDRTTATLSLDIALGDDPDAPTLPLTYTGEPRRQGETAAQYRTRLRAWLDATLVEARLLARAERERTRRPSERASDETQAEVVALISAPVDLDTATLAVP